MPDPANPKLFRISPSHGGISTDLTLRDLLIVAAVAGELASQGEDSSVVEFDLFAGRVIEIADKVLAARAARSETQ